MFIPLIYALLLLLSLRVFIPVLAALVAGVGSGIFKLLTWSGRLTLETRVEEVEYPVWH